MFPVGATVKADVDFDIYALAYEYSFVRRETWELAGTVGLHALWGLGLGLGYNRFVVDVDVDSNNYNGSLDWTYDGPQLFYSVQF